MSATAPKPKPKSKSALREAIDRPAHVPVIDEVGELASFIGKGVRGVRGLPSFPAEVLRQVGFIASGSALVIIVMSFVTGAGCGIAADAIGQAIGTATVGAIVASFCTTREIVPFIFGFIVAAKIGGGVVAQLGAMRVNEEVDALEIMGISGIVFLISSRLVAAALTMPMIYAISLGAGQGAAWIMSYLRSGSLSQGTWEALFYTVTGNADLMLSMVKGMVITAGVLCVALFYGWRVRGGPVDVGIATAKAMSANLILVVVLNMTMTFMFWGFDPRLPIA